MRSTLTALWPRTRFRKNHLCNDVSGPLCAMSSCWVGLPTLEPRTRSQLFPVLRGCDPWASPWSGFKGGDCPKGMPSPNTEHFLGTGQISTTEESCLDTAALGSRIEKQRFPQ